MTLHPVAWLFFSILVTFLVTRTITRTIRHRTARGGGAGPLRDFVLGGVHIHHQVFGILLMLVTGVALIAGTPEGSALDAAAVLFGMGVALTFDEFALWLHLEDVYWAQSGRMSVDAMFCILAATGMMIGGVDLVAGPVGSAAWWWSVLTLALLLALAMVCILKGKLFTAVVGLFLQPVLLVGALRLAKPSSWWARRHYAEQSRRLVRARRRFGGRYEARWNRVRDLIAGAPTVAPVAPDRAVPAPLVMVTKPPDHRPAQPECRP